MELNEYLEDQRFSQLIINSDIAFSSTDFETLITFFEIDPYEESEDTLEKITNASRRLKGII